MSRNHRSLTARFAVLVLLAGIVLAGCGGSSSKSSNAASSGSSSANSSSGSGAQVLPVTSNPIHNTATVQTLKISKIIVENNVDKSGKAVSDHLELVLQNSGTSPLSGFEVYYTVTDTKTNTSESYYTKVPASFSIPAGGSRTVHFDNTGQPDHLPINKFGLASTSKNALSYKVEVSANGAAVQTATAKKSAGGGEIAGQ